MKLTVIPAKAEIQYNDCYVTSSWIPACAGMTEMQKP